MMTGGVDDAADAPPVLFGDRRDLGSSGSYHPSEHRARVVDGQDHPDGRPATQRFRVRVLVLLHPEGGATDPELRDGHATRLVRETSHRDRAERRRVELGRSRRIGEGQLGSDPRGDGAMDWVAVGSLLMGTSEQ